MVARSLTLPDARSFFLIGPRGTGKSTLLRAAFPDAVFFDLLELSVYSELLAHPERLEALALPRMPALIVLDEIQRIPEDIDGPAVETLVLQELRATNDNHDLGYTLHYWRTRDKHEVDFVLYGERGLVAIEVTRAYRFREVDLDALKLFAADYPAARCLLFYGGSKEYESDGIRVLPLATALPRLLDLLG